MASLCPLIMSHFALICVALLLSACATTSSNIIPRPDDWAPAEVANPSASCPDISGVYVDGDVGCGDSHCRLLNVFLFRTDYPLAERIEISLISEEMLKIIGKWSGAKTEIVLSRRNGDFDCGPEGLFVTGSGNSFYAGWTAYGIAHETHTFNRCSDGSLVMRLEREMHGNAHLYPILPFRTHEVDWVRWKAAPALNYLPRDE